MSRIGNAIINVPKEATVTIDSGIVTVKGPKGELLMNIPSRVSVHIADGKIEVKRRGNDLSLIHI